MAYEPYSNNQLGLIGILADACGVNEGIAERTLLRFDWNYQEARAWLTLPVQNRLETLELQVARLTRTVEHLCPDKSDDI